MANGERLKLGWDSILNWATVYGTFGISMALSADSTFLIASSSFSSTLYLGKLDSADGTVLASYSSTAGSYYKYIYARDKRALCISETGKFQLVNTTDFSMLSNGGVSGQNIIAGGLFNSSHVIMSTQNAHILMMDNAGMMIWQQQQVDLASGL